MTLTILEATLYYMGRHAQFDEDVILDAACGLVATGGPSALTVAAVASALQAPSGSIYYRFESRDVLAATLWLRSIERFQAGWIASVRQDDVSAGMRRGARFVLEWCRRDLAQAQVLLLYRSSDLVAGPWPEALRARNAAQRRRLARALADLDDRCGATSEPERLRVRFAVTDVPLAAVQRPLRSGRRPPAALDDIVDDAVCAVLDSLPNLANRRNP